jgi:hypothetical protein
MMLHKISVLVVVACIAAGVAWNLLLLAVTGKEQWSFYSAAREINQCSNGLLALCYAALGVHVFLLQYLPSSWRS